VSVVPGGATDGASVGQTVALNGDRAVAGAPDDTDHGSAYALGRVDGEWRATARLVGPDPVPGGELGRAVALDEATALVGSPTTGEDGPGHAYLYEL
jgi:hypothetical protein